MINLDSHHLDQAAYWDEVSSTKLFTHPLDLKRFRAHVALDAPVLDFGCGYGRLCGELAAAGYCQLLGADYSPEMIRLAERNYPGVPFTRVGRGKLPFDSGAFSAVVLFAVLTCIPDSDEQDQLMRELERVLIPGGLLVVSDYPLQRDERNRQRYLHQSPRFSRYGVFRLPDGGIVRHHEPARFAELFRDFAVIDEVSIASQTMNGNAAEITQFWALRRPVPLQSISTPNV